MQSQAWSRIETDSLVYLTCDLRVEARLDEAPSGELLSVDGSPPEPIPALGLSLEPGFYSMKIRKPDFITIHL